MMTTRTWFLAAAATLAFGYLAPVEKGNGATLLFLLGAALLVIYNPLRRTRYAQQ